MATDRLIIDGGHGEGGGQILRTTLSLSAITGRPVRVDNIRAGRPIPGLAAQHVTAVRAAAAITRAHVEGAHIGSLQVEFTPTAATTAGAYTFDVAAAREGGSAGATTLVAQTVLLLLALARGESRVTIRGGTHMAWSPSFDYARDVWLPALGRLGVSASIELMRWGWFPVGLGEVQVHIAGGGDRGLRPLVCRERGSLKSVAGRAVAASLPAHIAQRMAARAQSLLRAEGFDGRVEAERVRAASPGAGIFLTAHYEQARCGFTALGQPGRPAERVAEDAVAALLAHHSSGAAVDRYLADQLIVPLALAAGESEFSTERLTRHLETNCWVVEQFDLARILLERGPGGTGLVTVVPERPTARSALGRRSSSEARHG